MLGTLNVEGLNYLKPNNIQEQALNAPDLQGRCHAAHATAHRKPTQKKIRAKQVSMKCSSCLLNKQFKGKTLMSRQHVIFFSYKNQKD